MTDPSLPLQKAILEALQTALDTPVYDDVPQGAAYPYVVISNQVIRPDDPLTRRRDDRFVYLSVWSEYAGQFEVLNIMAAIDATLHQARLPMESGRMVRSYVVRKITQREPDNKTFMGMTTVRVITEH